jgi:lipopolysaccharide transport system ATP-binding protein
MRHAPSAMPSSSDDTIWALHDVSFPVKRGEVLGIIGRNGAGKTTLLKILSRITKPTEGKAWINGRVASLLEVGTGFHPELTGRENIFLNGAILGMTKAEIRQKFDEIVEFAEIEKFIDTPVKRYSSGMYVRLAFAVAAHLEPEILLVDEVLAVGDAAFQKKCLGKMGNVAKEGLTVLFVSHNMAAIEALCPRCLVLANGEITFIGDTSKAITKYLNDNLSLKNVPLKERRDREGLGNVKIKEIEISAPQGLATGKTVTILATYESKGNIEIKEFGLSIWTNREVKLISLSTEFSGGLKNIPSEGIVTCKIPELPLVTGNYILNFFVSSIHGIEDYIVNALSFFLNDSNFFGSGKSVDPNWGAIAIKHKWELKKTI